MGPNVFGPLHFLQLAVFFFAVESKPDLAKLKGRRKRSRERMGETSTSSSSSSSYTFLKRPKQ